MIYIQHFFRKLEFSKFISALISLHFIMLGMVWGYLVFLHSEESFHKELNQE